MNVADWISRMAAWIIVILALVGPAFAQQKPSIVVIFGDDIGYWNVGAYTHGMMGRTPNMKKAIEETMRKMEHPRGSSN